MDRSYTPLLIFCLGGLIGGAGHLQGMAAVNSSSSIDGTLRKLFSRIVSVSGFQLMNADFSDSEPAHIPI
jgi:hypothetical protein